MVTVEDTVAPGTKAVIKDPPTDPEFGVTDTSFGVSSNDASTRE
jgi:hypothetical protein